MDGKGHGFFYETEVEICPDLGPFQAFRRKVFNKPVNSAAYLFELDIILQFRADFENNTLLDGSVKHSDSSLAYGRQSAWTRELFRIGSPLVESVLPPDVNPTVVGISEMLTVPKTCMTDEPWASIHDPHMRLVNATDASETNVSDRTYITTGGHAIPWAGTGEDGSGLDFFAENARKEGAFGILAGDIIGFPDPTSGNFTHDWSRGNRNYSWVVALTDAQDESGNIYSFEHQDLVTAPGGATPDVRTFGDHTFVIFPKIRIRDFANVKYWQMGDRLNLFDWDDMSNMFILGGLEETGDTFGYLWLSAPMQESVKIPQDTSLINIWAEGGPISVPYNPADTDADTEEWNNRPAADIETTLDTFSGRTRDVVRNPGSEFVTNTDGNQQAVYARLDVVPKNMNLQDGDVVKLECSNANTCNMNGYWTITKTRGWERPDPKGSDADVGRDSLFSERTGYYLNILQNASGDNPRLAPASMQALITLTDPTDRHLVSAFGQRNHVGGSVRITKITGTGFDPIAQISAVYTRDPYVRVEAIKTLPGTMKEEYIFPHREKEFYEQKHKLQCFGGTFADGFDYTLLPKTKVNCDAFRLLQGFSSVHIYCVLDDTLSRRLELYTALGDLHFDISNVRVRINEKYCIKGDEPQKWIYKEHVRVTESPATYVDWKEKVMVVSFDAESLALPNFVEGFARLYTMKVDFDIGYSKAWQHVVKNSWTTSGTLVRGASIRNKDHHKTFQFLNNLNVSARVVVENRRKGLRIDSGGDCSILPYLIQTAKPDGLTMGQTVQTTIRSGGDPNAYLKTF